MAPDRLFWLWSYEPPLDAVIAAYKFRGVDYLDRNLARAALDHLGHRLADIDRVTAVPLHWRRRWGRGYDQSARLAKHVARGLDVPFESCLTRRRGGRPQASLPRRQRLRNRSLDFRLRTPVDGLRGQHLLLVDDVLTTGATLQACTQALQPARFSRISWLVIGRTP